LPSRIEDFETRLRAFPWDTVRHAYGPATDLPDLLVRLLSEGDHESVWEELVGRLVHQSTRYPATLEAIPFLVEMLDLLPEARDRPEMVLFINAVALGDPSAHVVAGYHPENDRPVAFCARLHDRVEELLIPHMLIWAERAGNTAERRMALWSLSWFPDSAKKSRPILNAAQQEPGIIGRVAKFALDMLELAEDEDFNDEPWNEEERVVEHDKMLTLLLNGEGEDKA
jgi:hypothetical protein